MTSRSAAELRYLAEQNRRAAEHDGKDKLDSLYEKWKSNKMNAFTLCCVIFTSVPVSTSV